MAEEDASDDARAPEMVSEDVGESERASAQTVALSERAATKALKAAMKVMKKPKNTGGVDRRPRDAPAPTFRVMFDDYIHGMTPETMREKYKLTEETMRRKLPELELAKRRVIEGLRERGELPTDSHTACPSVSDCGTGPPSVLWKLRDAPTASDSVSRDT